MFARREEGGRGGREEGGRGGREGVKEGEVEGDGEMERLREEDLRGRLSF